MNVCVIFSVFCIFYHVSNQGFMQDQIIASHTCFGGQMDVNCQASLQTLKCVWRHEVDYKLTCDTIYTHF